MIPLVFADRSLIMLSLLDLGIYESLNVSNELELSLRLAALYFEILKRFVCLMFVISKVLLQHEI